MDEHFGTRGVDYELEELLREASSELLSRVSEFMYEKAEEMSTKERGGEFAARMEAFSVTVQEAIDDLR